ncbi:MAG: transketolase [Roseburia sp.]|nr:transketolase [Anaeroplasma bactoclasticum]MCM1196141.1 transketolase [Roseburia sp.]MCM1557138.1 transketolase [Anaeroplasma bactoclasticum]
MNDLTKKAYELRKDIIECVYRSKAGHIGGDLSVIDILVTHYYAVMNISPKLVQNKNRDRFILSKGHCVDALYMVLGDLGFFDKKWAMENFSKPNSIFIGHPNKEVNGIEINSGSLGHGLSLGVGMALAAKMDHLSYRTYIVLGDGEMAEGSNYEAMLAASHYKLDNLCATVDLNHLQISGKTEDVMNTTSLKVKAEAFGWNVIEVHNGNDCEELLKAYDLAKKVKEKPTLILAYTVKGKGVSFMENNELWHHGVLSEEQYHTARNQILEVLENE